MSDQLYSVHEVAELASITNKTLHYYDKIDLHKPTIVAPAKYRMYTHDDIACLQEILFYQKVGFGLKKSDTDASSYICPRRSIETPNTNTES